MTTSTNTPRLTYLTSDGSTVNFTFNFEIADQNSIAVYVGTTLKTLTTDYTVSFDSGTSGTGTITLNSAPAINTRVYLIRDTYNVRSTDFAQGGAFLAQTINNELDRITQGIQDVDNIVADKVLRVAEPTVETASLSIPAAATRANKVLVFDGSGNVSASNNLTVDITGNVTGNVTATTGTSTFNNVIVGGDLTVNGTTTTLNTTTLDVEDNIITLNSNVSGAPGANAGIEINRGSETDKSLIWDESADKWTIGSDTFVAGTVQANLTGNVTGNVLGNVTGDLLGDVIGDLNTGGITVADNNITATRSNDNLILKTSGTGKVSITGLLYPTTDGSADQFLKTDGAGNLSFGTVIQTLTFVGDDSTGTSVNTGESFKFAGAGGVTTAVSGDTLTITGPTGTLSNIVEDTTPQLGGNLDVNGNSIVSVSNGNIAITPNGTGSIVLDGLYWPQTDGSANTFLKTNGAGQLSWGSTAVLGIDIVGDDSTGVHLNDGETIKIAGGTGIDSIVSNDTVTLNIDSSVVTLSGSQSLTNKTFTTGTIIDDVTFSSTVNNAKKFKFDCNSLNTGTATFAFPSTSYMRFVGEDVQQTLTNKTITLSTGGNFDLNNSTIINSVTNSDIDINTTGTGNINLNADTVRVGDAAADAYVTTNGAGDLILNTNDGTNSGSITIQDGINQDIKILPNGTGKIQLDNNYWPNADGSSGQYLTTDGSGSLQWTTIASAATLGDFSFTGTTMSAGTTNADITITSSGTGNLNVDMDTLRIGDSNTDATITTNGEGDLILNTNSGTNSGNITIADGVNGNISITPNGTGDVYLSSDTVVVGDNNITANITTNGTGDLVLNTNGATNSGSIQIQAGANGDISVTPNGSGNINLNADTIAIGDNNVNVLLTTNGTGDLTINTNAGTNSGNITLSSGANNNISITPNGSGNVVIDSLTWPNTDGVTGQFLTTNGSGALSWSYPVSAIAGDLTFVGTTISTNVTNGNIKIDPNGTGEIQLEATYLRLGTGSDVAYVGTYNNQNLKLGTGDTPSEIGDAPNIELENGINGNLLLRTYNSTGKIIVGPTNNDATITTNGTGNLKLNTNSGTNSGSIEIYDGTNGNIYISPNGTGSIILTGSTQISGQNWPQADGTAGYVLKTNGLGQLSWNPSTITVVGDDSTGTTLNLGETVQIAGGTGLTSTVSGDTVTLDIDSTVATLTGSQTLTNKTLTAPIINGEISSSDSTAIQINDGLTVTGPIKTDTVVANVILSQDGSTVQISDSLYVNGNTEITGNLSAKNIDTNVISSSDSSAIQIDDAVNISGVATVNNDLIVTGDIAKADSLQFDTAAAETVATGKLYYSSAYGTLAHGLSDGTEIIDGIDLVTYVTNAEATTLTKGEVVYIFGASGDRPSVKRADNSGDPTSSKTLGIVKNDITAGSAGYVVTQGIITGLNTATYTAGDVLWLGTSGAFTATKPTHPAHLIFVGVVLRANAGNGLVYVKPQNGYELDELHDVNVSTAVANDVLRYDGSAWVNSPITGNLSITGSTITAGTTNADITITSSGTGNLNVDMDTLRVGDANATATITTNGTGDLVLNTNDGTNSGNITITQGANANITLTPNGTGDVILSADTVQIGDSNTDATITTNGTGDLILNTNAGTNSGTITIQDGTAGKITVIPNTTGLVELGYENNTTNFPTAIGNNGVSSGDARIKGTTRLYSNLTYAPYTAATSQEVTAVDYTMLKTDGGSFDSTNIRQSAANHLMHFDLNGGSATTTTTNVSATGVGANNNQVFYMNNAGGTKTGLNIAANRNSVNIVAGHGGTLTIPRSIAYLTDLNFARNTGETTTITEAWAFRDQGPQYTGTGTTGTNSVITDYYAFETGLNYPSSTNTPWAFYIRSATNNWRSRIGALDLPRRWGTTTTHSSGAAYTVDYSIAGHGFRQITLTSNITSFTMSNFPTNTNTIAEFDLVFIQDGVGGRTISFTPTSTEVFKFRNGTNTLADSTAAPEVLHAKVFVRYDGTKSIFYWDIDNREYV